MIFSQMRLPQYSAGNSGRVQVLFRLNGYIFVYWYTKYGVN